MLITVLIQLGLRFCLGEQRLMHVNTNSLRGRRTITTRTMTNTVLRVYRIQRAQRASVRSTVDNFCQYFLGFWYADIRYSHILSHTLFFYFWIIHILAKFPVIRPVSYTGHVLNDLHIMRYRPIICFQILICFDLLYSVHVFIFLSLTSFMWSSIPGIPILLLSLCRFSI